MTFEMPHSDILFIELIRLYVLSNDTNTISKNALENALAILIEIVEEETNSDIYYDFEEELNEFLDKYSDFFNESTKDITITEDIEIIYETILKSLKPNTIDFDISRLIYNTDIYKALNINIPRSIIAPYLDANKRLLSVLTAIASNESNNYDSSDLIENLERIRDYLIDLFNNIDNATLTKINIITHLYDLEHMPEVNDTEDYPWMIIIFSNSSEKWQTITYSTIASYANEIFESQSSKNEMILNDFFEDYEPSEEPKITLNIIEVFLTIFIIYLNKFLKITGNIPGKDTIIIKKYLLLSLPELGESLEYFLNNKTLDNMPLPILPEQIEEDYENELYQTFKKIIPEIHISNQRLDKNPKIYSDIITKAIFIKTFLKIARNNHLKDQLNNKIANPNYYKNPGYEISTDIIDSIIFNDNLDLIR